MIFQGSWRQLVSHNQEGWYQYFNECIFPGQQSYLFILCMDIISNSSGDLEINFIFLLNFLEYLVPTFLYLNPAFFGSVPENAVVCSLYEIFSGK